LALDQHVVDATFEEPQGGARNEDLAGMDVVGRGASTQWRARDRVGDPEAIGDVHERG